MQYTAILAITFTGLISASPFLTPRETDRPCFHEPSAALCCPASESGDLLVIATNRKTPNITSTTSALAFRSSCLEAGLVAQCCELANSSNSTGIVCAPVPADPPS